jgi:YHS domain-containing protein
MREQIEDLPGAEFVPVGKRSLKGIADDVAVYRVRRPRADALERYVDVVCGMELRPDEVSARLDVGSRTQVFCSSECLQRFVAAPERYTA